MNTDFYEKLRYLSLVVGDHCKKTHISIVCYVLSKAKNKKSKKMAEFDALFASNNLFEHNYNVIIKKYIYQLEGKTGDNCVFTSDELSAFTKAYELQKNEMKNEYDNLSSMGASKDTLQLIDDEIAEWTQFYSDFNEHAKNFKKQ